MTEFEEIVGARDIVVVANRLPVDRVTAPDGDSMWQPSPGGLVTAMQPVVQQLGCSWIGWAGTADEQLAPFTLDRMRLVPVPLSGIDVTEFYEGFSNGTLWPLYHDVIVPPEYHREWWDRYVAVNRRFAEAAAAEAPRGALIWVHDYQLQLVPAMLRELRPDLIIAFYLHIPFPARSLFAQLPWRRRILEGMLGADVIGFQREQDAANFRAAAERYAQAPSHGNRLYLGGDTPRTAIAQEFPISIDTATFADLAARPTVQTRAREIRAELGNPHTLLLGVDRLDYTKGIRHRLKAFAELLGEGELSPDDTVLVQVATPSRERVAAYRQLRGEVETTVGRINGDHGAIGHTPVVYLHQAFSREEMAALYLAADVAVVTALRDGMNLVAKEYVACRHDNTGVLLLSEFTGAADELSDALLVNPHDIEGLKAGVLRAAHMPEREQHRRMRALRAAVHENDVAHWAASFLRAVGSIERTDAVPADSVRGSEPPSDQMLTTGPILLPSRVSGQLRRLATAPELIVACDFDGTVAPIVRRPSDARILDRAQRALTALHDAPGAHVAVLTGRSVQGLLDTGIAADGWLLAGSHGAEVRTTGSSARQPSTPSDEETQRVTALQRRLERVFGHDHEVEVERKPFGVALHTRRVSNAEHAAEIVDAASAFAQQAGFAMRDGKQVREFSVRVSDKGQALELLRAPFPGAPVLFLGDDLTDEDAFRVLRRDDVGVKIGPGETAARMRLPDPDAAAALLARLAVFRCGIVIGD